MAIQPMVSRRALAMTTIVSAAAIQAVRGGVASLRDRDIDDPQEALQRVSAVTGEGSTFGEGEAFNIRGFPQQDIFKDGEAGVLR
jgi:hypothetical protein